MTETFPQQEESNIKCQFCGEQTPSEYNFCVECDNQIKCFNCGVKTYPGKTYCLRCSEPLAPKQITNQAPNQYERRVKQDGEKYDEYTRFALSDNAVREIAPFVVNQTMPGLKGQDKPTPPPLPNTQTIETSYEDLTSEEDNSSTTRQQNEKISSDDSSQTEGQTADKAVLEKIFQRDGDALVSIDNDFKGQNWSEQQRNFIILFTKAYKEFFNKALPDKEIIKNSAVKLRLADPNNFKTYLNKTVTASMTQTSNGYILNANGEKEYKRILECINNQSSKPGYNYWNRPSSSPAPQVHLKKDDKSKVLSWISEEVDLKILDIRDVKNARDYALLSYWIITHLLKKSNSLKWNEAHLYLVKKFDTTSVTPGAFRKAVTKEESEKYFTKNSDGLYYLTSDGQKLVESWIKGTGSVKKQEA